MTTSDNLARNRPTDSELIAAIRTQKDATEAAWVAYVAETLKLKAWIAVAKTANREAP